MVLGIFRWYWRNSDDDPSLFVFCELVTIEGLADGGHEGRRQVADDLDAAFVRAYDASPSS